MTTAIDLFAGAGGFTEGASQAGVDVLWAANHSQSAVAYHAANHPGVAHSCQDLLQADFTQVPDHDILLASPACPAHSNASQGARKHGGSNVHKKHDRDRNTAWAVTSCADVKRPDTIIVENVPQFLRWQMYPAWRLALECVGYVVTEHVFDASTFGVPQNRKRVIITARMGEALQLESPDLDPVAFGRCVDLDDAGDGWDLVSSKTKAVQSRVARGRDRGLGDVFLTQHVTNHPGRSLSRPIGTLTTKQQWALVRGDSMRMLTVPELRRAMSFPDSYDLPSTKVDAGRMLGNAIPPIMARELVRQAVA